MALPHTTDIFKYPARFQFGQSGAPCGGSSCCTDTCIQMIVEYYKEVTKTLSRIRQVAQAETSFNEAPCTGINHIEVLNALEHFGITHYKVAFGGTAYDVWNRVAVGPVIVGVHYGSYPNWASGTRSNRAEVGGRTDYPFTGAHAVLAIGRRYHTVNGVTHKDIYTRDPDHNSPARPERPLYDRMKITQLNTAMRNLVPYTAFTNTYMIYPTRKKTL